MTMFIALLFNIECPYFNRSFSQPAPARPIYVVSVSPVVYIGGWYSTFASVNNTQNYVKQNTDVDDVFVDALETRRH